jgi:hypothetical protein
VKVAGSSMTKISSVKSDQFRLVAGPRCSLV